MRVGLLTRFMGVLGIITGVLQILPFGGPLPVVQCFWLLMLGILFLGRWPGGQPPAWRTGNARAVADVGGGPRAEGARGGRAARRDLGPARRGGARARRRRPVAGDLVAQAQAQAALGAAAAARRWARRCGRAWRPVRFVRVCAGRVNCGH